MGGSGVGKSCLLKQLMTQLDHHPTHKLLSKREKDGSLPININVLFCLNGIGRIGLNISEHPYIDSNVCLKPKFCVPIICFSAADKQSFEQAAALIYSGSEFLNFDCYLKILVSTKNDLQQTQQVVSSEPKKLAGKNKMIFMQTSAEANINVLPLFEIIATAASDFLNGRKIDITNVMIQPLSAFKKPQKTNAKILSSCPTILSSSSVSFPSSSSSSSSANHDDTLSSPSGLSSAKKYSTANLDDGKQAKIPAVTNH